MTLAAATEVAATPALYVLTQADAKITITWEAAVASLCELEGYTLTVTKEGDDEPSKSIQLGPTATW